MHLAVHSFSLSSSLAPGRVTQRSKHLSVIFCARGQHTDPSVDECTHTGDTQEQSGP